MHLTRWGIFYIVVVFIFAFSVSGFMRYLCTDVGGRKLPFADSVSPHLPLSDSSDNLFWFVQISDLHVSIFQDENRIIELREFCDLSLKVVKPAVVLATGDLTDSKVDDAVGSKQLVEEWTIYSDVIQKCGILNTTTWLDIRGNHDNFNVPGVSSPQNLFKRYSVQGIKHERSYMHIHDAGNMKYAFIGVDGCPDQGLKKPFNFVGYISSDEISHLIQLDQKASQSSNYTIWFGHYPTSCMINNNALRELIGSRKNSFAYLCGHYHAILNMVPNMYTMQKEHFLELELSDWKENRMYRILAIDHGLLSFVDVKHKVWPVILILNPKHAMFRLRLKEPDSIVHSTHIRILVFSPNELTFVDVQVDNGDWTRCKPHSLNKNLYLSEWNPSDYSKGIHEIKVKAVDQLGRENVISQPFSLDESHSEFAVLPRIFLILSFSSVLQVFFVITLTNCVIPLLILKASGYEKNKSIRRLIKKCSSNWVRRLWLLSNCSWLFYTLIFYPLYIAVGPWSIGEVIDGHVGIIFIWGVFVNNQFIQELSTYGQGFIQLAFFHIPLVLVTAYALELRLKAVEKKKDKKIHVNMWLCKVPFLCLVLCHIGLAYSFWAAHGLLSVALGPLRSLPVVMSVGAWWYTSRLPISEVKVLSDRWMKLMTTK